MARRPHLDREQVPPRGQHDPRELEGDRCVESARAHLDVLARALRVLDDVRLGAAVVAQYPEGALRGDLARARGHPSCGISVVVDRRTARTSAFRRARAGTGCRFRSSSVVGGGTTMMLYKVCLPEPAGYRARVGRRPGRVPLVTVSTALRRFIGANLSVARAPAQVASVARDGRTRRCRRLPTNTATRMARTVWTRPTRTNG